MPRSIRFHMRNRWSHPDTTISVSSEILNEEGTQTQNPALYDIWRATSNINEWIACDFGQARVIEAVSLVRCSLTAVGTYRIRVGNDPTFATNLFDSGTRTRQRYFSDLEIVAARTSEFYSAGLPTAVLGRHIQYQVIDVLLPSAVSARYVRVDLNDPTRISVLGAYIAHVYAGKVLRPQADLALGWQVQRDQLVRNGQASCGQYWSAVVRTKTLINLTMAPQPESEVMTYWNFVQTLISDTDPFVVCLTDTTDSFAYTTTIFGKFVTVPTLQQVGYKSYSLSMQIEEIIN